jgi:putative phosphoribosyl transferase
MELSSSLRRDQRALPTEHAIPAQDLLLEATLTVPSGARGVVVLPHANSAGRFDRRYLFGAEVLQQAGMATLQVDLLTPAEEASFPLHNQREGEVALLSERLLSTLAWLQNQAEVGRLAIGVFACTPETVAALIAAEKSGRVVAVVSKGGFPDFLSESMTRLTGPTLLLLGPQELSRAEELAAEFFARHLG